MENLKTVGQVMRKNIPSVSPDDSLRKAAKVMVENHIWGLPVVQDGKIVGIFTDGDMLNAFYLNISAFSYEEKSEGSDNGRFKQRVDEFKNLKVKDIMTLQPRTINESAGVDEAAGLLKRFKIKRLIVVNDRGQLLGMIERLNIVDSIVAD
ncbi:MAG: CBS domain-containing protein [Candidatus Micrarchaeota archaeon]